jgi:hypothetical protein
MSHRNTPQEPHRAMLRPFYLRYPLYRKLCEPQGRSGRERRWANLLPLPEFKPRTVLTVASRYTDWAIILTEPFFNPRHPVYIFFARALKSRKQKS